MAAGPSRFGFHASLVACVASIGFSVVQILQVLDLLSEPADEILIYATSLCIATPYVLATLALHHATTRERKIWTHAALLMGLVYAVYVSLNYVVQLTTVIPARYEGSSSTVAFLEQTPHSLFWDVDALGYIFLGLSTLFAAVGIDPRERWLRRFLVANTAITPLIVLVYFYPRFSIGLLLLATPWLVTVPGALLLLTRYFHRLEAHRRLGGLSRDESRI